MVRSERYMVLVALMVARLLHSALGEVHNETTDRDRLPGSCSGLPVGLQQSQRLSQHLNLSLRPHLLPSPSIALTAPMAAQQSICGVPHLGTVSVAQPTTETPAPQRKTTSIRASYTTK